MRWRGVFNNLSSLAFDSFLLTRVRSRAHLPAFARPAEPARGARLRHGQWTGEAPCSRHRGGRSRLRKEESNTSGSKTPRPAHRSGTGRNNGSNQPSRKPDASSPDTEKPMRRLRSPALPGDPPHRPRGVSRPERFAGRRFPEPARIARERLSRVPEISEKLDKIG